MSEPPLKCDFCSAPEVTTEFPARDHEQLADAYSLGSWCACDVCVELIEASDRYALARRCAHGFCKKHDIPPRGPLFEEIEAEVTTIHAKFWASRTGPGQPLTDDRRRGYEALRAEMGHGA